VESHCVDRLLEPAIILDCGGAQMVGKALAIVCRSLAIFSLSIRRRHGRSVMVL